MFPTGLILMPVVSSGPPLALYAYPVACFLVPALNALAWGVTLYLSVILADRLISRWHVRRPG